ncbi:MAG: rod shape-determining protein MreC [Deltaproteobacteria bacterium]|nr:rod shape-determining protein MreC [Deltaproteobacteria bacterium]
MSFKRRAFLALLLIVLFVVLLNVRRDRPQVASPSGSATGAGFVDRLIVSLFGPVQGLVDHAVDFVENGWSNYFAVVGAKKENVRLKEEIRLKDLEILSLKERLRSQDREELLSQKAGLLGGAGVKAKVTGYDPYAVSQTMWVSAGSSQGIAVDCPVLTLEGLVGRIVKVFPSMSQVLLLVDPHFAVDVIDEATRVRALVVGSGRGVELKRYPFLTHLEFLNLGDEIRKGDLLITSGFGAIYPPGIPVGSVIDVAQKENDLFQSSGVLPAVDFGKLEEVVILTEKK